MTRRHRLGALGLAAALLIAACGGTPEAPELTEPTEILAAAATTTAAATSTHIDLTAEGQLAFDLTGSGSGAPLELADTTASADVDIAGGDARVTFAVPGVLNIRGELIVVDGTAYAKTSLTGPQYQTFALGDAVPTDPSASPDTGSMLAALTEFLAQPGLEPVKGEDVDCGGTRCYVVTIELTAEELAALGVDSAELPVPSGLPVPLPDLSGLALDVTVRVEKPTTRLAGLTVAARSGVGVDVVADVRFSKWDEDVTIEPPPADEIEGGG